MWRRRLHWLYSVRGESTSDMVDALKIGMLIAHRMVSNVLESPHHTIPNANRATARPYDILFNLAYPVDAINILIALLLSEF